MTTDDRTPTDRLLTLPCYSPGIHPPHVWWSRDPDPDAARELEVRCPGRTLEEASRRVEDDAPEIYPDRLSEALQSAAALVADQIAPPGLDLSVTVELDPDVDDPRPAQIGLTLDGTGHEDPGKVLADTIAYALRLGLAEFAAGNGWAEWAGTVAGDDVTLVAYWAADDTFRSRIRRYLTHPAATAAILGVTAGVGAVTALAARRALTGGPR